MEQRHEYSHGLLYSVLPDDLPSLHLMDEEEGERVERVAKESRSIWEFVSSYLRKIISRFGVRP
jgi:hypothetical protein